MAGRPRQFDRETALTHARDLFWRCGYEGTSLSDLVSALGIASARIYKAFGSKEQLFREAIENYEQHEGGFAEIALTAPDIQTAMRSLLENAVRLYAEPERALGCMVVSSTSGVSDENKSLAAWLTQRRQIRTQGIIARIEKAATEGQLHQDADPTALGHYFATVLHGLSVQARDGESQTTLLGVVSQAMSVLNLNLNHQSTLKF